MNKTARLREIRNRLELSQTELGDAMGLKQATISDLEVGRMEKINPEAAQRLITFARARGLALTFDMVYGAEHLPAAAAKDESAAARP